MNTDLVTLCDRDLDLVTGGAPRGAQQPAPSGGSWWSSAADTVKGWFGGGGGTNVNVNTGSNNNTGQGVNTKGNVTIGNGNQ